jgi:DNA-binding SARP family transcriptional activator
MEFGLLGPLRVCRGGAEITIAAGKQRAVLAALLLNSGRVVPAGELAGVLWGVVPPPSAAASVQNYVRRLRRALGDEGHQRIGTRSGGYVMSTGPGELDVEVFGSLLAAARGQARAGEWEAVAAGLARALELWRGEPLADVGCDELAVRELPRLGEMRLQAIEARIEADLHLGRQAGVIAELQSLVAAHPLRERLHGLLMLALYRDGRLGEALAAYQRARQFLIEELGTEPGRALAGLHQQMLTGDPALDPPWAQGQAVTVPAWPATAPAVAGVDVRFSLQPDSAAFIGREAELGRITAAVLEGAPGGGVVAIHAIGGMPGVGETALAVHAAHLLREEFPVRCLFIDLDAHTPGHDLVLPGTALAGLLAAAAVAARQLPGDVEGGRRCGGTRWPGSAGCWCWITRLAAGRCCRCCRAAAPWCW